MYLSTSKMTGLILILALLAGCSLAPVTADKDEPEILTIFPDGTMKLMDRYVASEDIVIYPDGYGGEKAAIKVRLEPPHPAFYRDSIIVNRVGDTLVTDNK